MKLLRRSFLLFGLFTAVAFTSARAAEKAPLTSEQKAFLDHYGAIHLALAADNLGAAKSAAAAITKGSAADVAAAKKIASAESIDAARDAFKPLSKSAVALAAGQPGFFHAHCPMVPNQEGDWVQTTKKISNPYFGKAMLTCGSIEG